MMADGLTNLRGYCDKCHEYKLLYQRGHNHNCSWVCDDCWESSSLLGELEDE